MRGKYKKNSFDTLDLANPCAIIMLMDRLRLFIAIEIDDELKRALVDVQRRLKAEPAARFVRWVAADGIHLTLEFLGDVDAARVPELSHALERASAKLAPFRLTARGLGCFPSLTRPNVLWVGVEGEVESAKQLARNVQDECARLGFERDVRGFTPHLTLGRVKRDVRPSDSRLVGEMVQKHGILDAGELKVEQVYLMQSDLRPGGAVYSVESRVRLTSGIERQE